MKTYSIWLKNGKNGVEHRVYFGELDGNQLTGKNSVQVDAFGLQFWADGRVTHEDKGVITHLSCKFVEFQG